MTTIQDAWPATSGSITERQAQLRALTEEVTIPIPSRAVLRLWGQRMVLAAAWVAATDPNVPAPLRILCRATYDNLMGGLFNDLDTSDPTQAPTIKAFLDGLQEAGVLSAEVRAETLALGREVRRVFADAEIDHPALYAAGLISAEEAGLKGG